MATQREENLFERAQRLATENQHLRELVQLYGRRITTLENEADHARHSAREALAEVARLSRG